MHIIKYYPWKSLVRLVLEDIQRVHGIEQPDTDFHLIAGLDRNGNIFARVDLKPLGLPDDKSRLGG